MKEEIKDIIEKNIEIFENKLQIYDGQMAIGNLDEVADKILLMFQSVNRTVRPQNSLMEIANTLQEVDNEGTSAPYWLILDPDQNMRRSFHELASQITGPFFSREDAEKFLKTTRYNFSSRAVVFCHSGNYSMKYKNLCDSLKIGHVKNG